MNIPRKEIPAFVRKCWEAHRKANIEVRESEKERLRFYAGGDGQWRTEEITKRRNQGRPWVTVNKCKPAVDQIEGDIRINQPGPQCHPVGGGADADTADIIEGMIREIEYRSHAQTAYATAGKYVAASGCAYLELATEWESDRSFEQRLVIKSIEDPATVFFDPTARLANRQDAAWAGKLRMYSKEEYTAKFGKNRKVLQPRGGWEVIGWMQEAMGVEGTLAQINEWTGSGKGPFFVAEFYHVEYDEKILRKYSDLIARYDDETVPKGVKALEGEENKRTVMRPKIVKYLVDALEILDDTDWPGTLIPIFPVLGPEVYIEGKLHRLSLISGAIDAQRALNYSATTACEVVGYLPRAPFIGAKGSFDDPRWDTIHSEMWAYVEYTPVQVTNEMGQQALAPPPQRNTMEASIQWILGLAQYFSDAIKAVTSIYDPSLGQQKNDQSGKAIEQLRSESNVGNYSYADNLHRAIGILYGQICCILPKITDSARAVTIIRADQQHEIVKINQTFPDGVKKGPNDKENNICLGEYSVRVSVARNFEERQAEALASLLDFIKIDPQIVANPGVAAAIMRLMGEGNPRIEQIADLLAPNTNGNMTPEQMQAQIQQLTAKDQQNQIVIQKLHMALAAGLPKVEADKYKAFLDSLTKIRVAEITASKDADNAQADREASMLETKLGMAHEAATQAVDHAHEQNLQESQQQAASQQQDQAHQQALEQQAAEPQPAGAAQ